VLVLQKKCFKSDNHDASMKTHQSVLTFTKTYKHDTGSEEKIEAAELYGICLCQIT
jgi:hypothetical protein